eukprot:CAMPEP_0183352084 /NCGR_PEP_ID=MMETSP0164_2-20130417/27456_1 /TAXON_ID=221442 /ORGANISM="Coccolithus pelagicus ssp braarudi, Strain PLY182g" /LENGTH=212 /DNA_ID=CAMNT_0025524437 /DNA_START=25 /DNA_END=663 /DNA_ORIENTATION=+
MALSSTEDTPTPSQIAWNCTQVVIIALVAAVAGELAAYVMIYRTGAYQRLSASVDKVTKRIDKKKESVAGAAANSSKTSKVDEKSKAKQKKIDRIEKRMMPSERNLAILKMRVQVVSTVTHLGALAWMYNKYSGIVCARLPFSFSFLSMITHRSLPGEDWTECSVIFLYMLCSLAIKPNLQRFLHVPSAISVSMDPFASMQKAMLAAGDQSN